MAVPVAPAAGASTNAAPSKAAGAAADRMPDVDRPGEEADRQLLSTIVSIIPDPLGLNCKVGGAQGGEVASGESLSTIHEATG